MRLASNKLLPVRCPACDRIVKRRSRQQTFCSTRCRNKAHKTPWTLKTPVRYHPSQERERTPINLPMKTISCNGQKRGRAVCPRTELSAPVRLSEPRLLRGVSGRMLSVQTGSKATLAASLDGRLLPEIRNWRVYCATRRNQPRLSCCRYRISSLIIQRLAVAADVDRVPVTTILRILTQCPFPGLIAQTQPSANDQASDQH